MWIFLERFYFRHTVSGRSGDCVAFFCFNRASARECARAISFKKKAKQKNGTEIKKKGKRKTEKEKNKKKNRRK